MKDNISRWGKLHALQDEVRQVFICVSTELTGCGSATKEFGSISFQMVLSNHDFGFVTSSDDIHLTVAGILPDRMEAS